MSIFLKDMDANKMERKVKDDEGSNRDLTNGVYWEQANARLSKQFEIGWI